MTREGSTPTERARLTDDLLGYEVEGRDETIGTIERISLDGAWAIVSARRLLGSRYVLPAHAVRLVDPESEAILVDLGKDELARSPAYDDRRGFDGAYEDAVRAYYGALRAGRSRPR